ncbi:MAG: hypothetical protein Q8O63_04545 [Hoeflea sp.]|nr:hypothetical protein [Hoeflea sp.]
MQGQRGFWDVEDRLKELSAEGDPHERLSATVDFKMFRPLLLKVSYVERPALQEISQTFDHAGMVRQRIEERTLAFCRSAHQRRSMCEIILIYVQVT